MAGCSLRQRVNAQGSCSLAIGGLASTANLWMTSRVAEPEGAVPITPFRACNPKRANILTQADPAWALLNRRLGLKPCTLCVRPRVWVSVRSKATSAKQGARVAQTADLRSAAFRSGFATSRGQEPSSALPCGATPPPTYGVRRKPWNTLSASM